MTKNKINDQITYQSVRVNYQINDSNQSQIMSNAEAKSLAKTMNLDLVLINENANPPVCRIIDYSKFLYELKKNAKSNNSNQITVKEINLSPEIGTHDVEFKSNNTRDFLKKGFHVKLLMIFKGRQITFKAKGEKVLMDFAKALSDVSKIDAQPVLNGKKIILTLKPIK